jgi:hypothetical protein
MSVKWSKPAAGEQYSQCGRFRILKNNGLYTLYSDGLAAASFDNSHELRWYAEQIAQEEDK